MELLLLNVIFEDGGILEPNKKVISFQVCGSVRSQAVLVGAKNRRYQCGLCGTQNGENLELGV